MAVSVLVTGGIGFVGSAIVNAIREAHSDWRIVVLDVRKPVQVKANVEYEVGSVTDGNFVDSVCQKVRPRVIIHTAGFVPDLDKRYSRDQRALVYEINVKGTESILKVAKERGVEAFVWTGSCTAVTDDMHRNYRNIDESVPTSTKSLVYGESKVNLPSKHENSR